jgi:hypothetical protein
MAIEHTIHTREGGLKEVSLYRATAIKVFCTECMGWDSNPKECTAQNCALFPFRGKSQLAFSDKE